MIRPNGKTSAFTMLEVAVVVGILAVVGAILIPMVANMRNQLGDIACQDNLRQLLGALEMYNIDHNGSMPYGIYYVGSGPPTWAPPPGGNNEFISWASELNQYFGDPKGYAPAFRCPQAIQAVGPHLISYVMNFIVAVSPFYEVQIGNPPNAQTKPAKLHLMLPQGTAMIWDTAVRSDWASNTGYLVGADLDDQRFWNGANAPQFRYYLPHDPFGNFPPGTLGNNRPVRFSFTFRNIDPVPPSAYPYQGNLRFRHTKQTQCNAAFSDGSVRKLTATIGPNDTVTAHDAIRRYFMINWPVGATPNPAFPSMVGSGGGLPLYKNPIGAIKSEPKQPSLGERN